MKMKVKNIDLYNAKERLDLLKLLQSQDYESKFLGYTILTNSIDLKSLDYKIANDLIYDIAEKDAILQIRLIIKQLGTVWVNENTNLYNDYITSISMSSDNTITFLADLFKSIKSWEQIFQLGKDCDTVEMYNQIGECFKAYLAENFLYPTWIKENYNVSITYRDE